MRHWEPARCHIIEDLHGFGVVMAVHERHKQLFPPVRDRAVAANILLFGGDQGFPFSITAQLLFLVAGNGWWTIAISRKARPTEVKCASSDFHLPGRWRLGRFRFKCRRGLRW